MGRNDSQKQSAGDNSTNVAAQGDVVINNIVEGVTETRAREIATEVMRTEIDMHTAEARAQVEERFEAFGNDLVSAVQKKGIELSKFGDPKNQFALHASQRLHAETANEETKDISIDMLSDFIGSEKLNSKSIIYKQALERVPYLTLSQVNLLTVLFFTQRVQSPQFAQPLTRPIKQFLPIISFFATQTERFAENYHPEPLDLENLELNGCVRSNSFSNVSHVQNLLQYKDNIPHPLSENEVAELQDKGIDSAHFSVLGNASPPIFFLNYSALYAGSFADKTTSIREAVERAIELSNRNIDEGALEQILSAGNFIPNTCDIFKQEKIRQAKITSIGISIAISHARKSGVELDESIWFPT